MFKDTVLVQSQIPSTQMKFFAIMRNNQSEVDNIYGELSRPRQLVYTGAPHQDSEPIGHP